MWNQELVRKMLMSFLFYFSVYMIFTLLAWGIFCLEEEYDFLQGKCKEKEYMNIQFLGGWVTQWGYSSLSDQSTVLRFFPTNILVGTLKHESPRLVFPNLWIKRSPLEGLFHLDNRERRYFFFFLSKRLLFLACGLKRRRTREWCTRHSFSFLSLVLKRSLAICKPERWPPTEGHCKDARGTGPAVLQVSQSHQPLHGYLLLPQEGGRREGGQFTTWDRLEYCMLVKV